VIGKTFENCLLEKLNLVNESELQFGFTKGLFPLIAGLLMSKAKYEILQVQKTLFIGLFDVQSAFDVVQHIILMDKLFNQKIPLALWSIIDDMYSGLCQGGTPMSSPPVPIRGLVRRSYTNE
jgi:hypothetical protein